MKEFLKFKGQVEGTYCLVNRDDMSCILPDPKLKNSKIFLISDADPETHIITLNTIEECRAIVNGA